MRNNTTSGYAGGIFVYFIENVSIDNNTITNNSAAGYQSYGGGGIVYYSGSSSTENVVTITNNTIYRNNCGNYGGGIFVRHLNEKETVNI